MSWAPVIDSRHPGGAMLARMVTEIIDAEVAECFLGANARRVFRLQDPERVLVT